MRCEIEEHEIGMAWIGWTFVYLFLLLRIQFLGVMIVKDSLSLGFSFGIVFS